MADFEIRKAIRDCHCRVCDKAIMKQTEEIMHTYSFRNRGMNVIICKPCIDEIGKAFNESSN